MTRPACKPHSVQREIPPGWTSILAEGYPSALAIYPEMIGKRTAPVPLRGLLSCLTLHRMGVACPDALLHLPVVSYTTISPLLTLADERYHFCGPIQTLTRFRALPGMLPCGVRTFLGHLFARGHPANLDSYYTVKLLEKCRIFGISNQVLGIGRLVRLLFFKIISYLPTQREALALMRVKQNLDLPMNVRITTLISSWFCG